MTPLKYNATPDSMKLAASNPDRAYALVEEPPCLKGFSTKKYENSVIVTMMTRHNPPPSRSGSPIA
ncbi:hypothetical protein D3C79_747020 [compost metagenome]